MSAWDTTAAAPRIADTAKRMASPLISEYSNILLMRMGADLALHELQMAFIASGKNSITVKELTKQFEKLRASLQALTPEGQPNGERL